MKRINQSCADSQPAPMAQAVIEEAGQM